MAIALHDALQFFRGDTWEIEFQCNDSAGVPLDLTGASIEWKLDTMGRVNVQTRTTADRITIADPARAGICVLSLRKDDTTTILAGYYQDQLRVTTAAGLVSVQSTGRIESIEPL
jgi:hypothetical protein